MSIIDRLVPYEILHRFDVEGHLAGVHYVERRIIDLDGERIKDEVGPARPVSLVGGEGAELLTQILGEAHLAAVRAAEAALAATAAVEAEAALRGERILEIEAERDRLAADVARHADEVRALTADVEALRAELSRLRETAPTAAV